MIITVTMNPAIDKTVELPKLICGGLNRIENIMVDAGGKGINVSKTMKELGGETIATGFVGGNNGQTLNMLLGKQGIATDFVEVNGETRINTKIVEANGNVTELNEAGPTISEEKKAKLQSKLLRYAKKDMWFVFSGSVPSGIPKTIYRDLIEKVHEKGAKVLLDADGELFACGLEARPDVIKPNRTELEKYIGSKERLTEKQLLSAGIAILEKGIQTVIISLGEEGALFLTKEKQLKCSAVPMEVQSTVGAGDAMVAAFVYGQSEGKSLEECAKMAIAASAGAVATEGTKPAKIDVVKRLMQQVCVKEIQAIDSDTIL